MNHCLKDMRLFFLLLYILLFSISRRSLIFAMCFCALGE